MLHNADHRIGADRAAYAIILNPILALLVSTVFEGYHWAPLATAGAVLVLLGNVIVLTPSNRLAKFIPGGFVGADSGDTVKRGS